MVRAKWLWQNRGAKCRNRVVSGHHRRPPRRRDADRPTRKNIAELVACQWITGFTGRILRRRLVFGTPLATIQGGNQERPNRCPLERAAGPHAGRLSGAVLGKEARQGVNEAPPAGFPVPNPPRRVENRLSGGRRTPERAQACRQERAARTRHRTAWAWGITLWPVLGRWRSAEGTLRDRCLRSERVCRAAGSSGRHWQGGSLSDRPDARAMSGSAERSATHLLLHGSSISSGPAFVAWIAALRRAPGGVGGGALGRMCGFSGGMKEESDEQPPYAGRLAAA